MKSAAIAAVLVFVPSLLAVPAPKDDATDQQRIQGTWNASSGEVGGKPDPRLLRVKLTFEKDNVTATEREGKEETYQFKLDPSQKPKTLDIMAKGETVLAIYALDGDTLKLCFDKEGKVGRPTEFASKPGTELTLIVFKREKK